MSLYKMELYKICHRKIFIIGSISVVLLLILYFWFVEVGEEIATVDGVRYKGYEAVQMDREVTEKYSGVLTDAKVADIVDTYGFPKKVEQNIGRFLDANYVNDYVVTYLSDGYFRSWDNYQIATKVYPIADTELGKVVLRTGKPVELFYTTGWKVFLEMLQMGMMLGSILILLGTAAVFSDEKQTNMQPLIFTTEQGKTRDIGAKIAAAFTVTAAIDGVILVLAFGLCRLVYGLDGCGTAIYFILRYTSLRHPLSYCPCSAFALITVLLALLGSAVLCGMTLWISARCASSFHALAAAAICWGAPFLVRIFFGGFGFLLVSGTPVFLVMTNNIWDIYSFWLVPLTFAILLLIGSVTSGYRVYKNSV